VPISTNQTLHKESYLNRNNAAPNSNSDLRTRNYAALFAASFLQNVFQDTPSIIQSLFLIRGRQQPVHLHYPYVCVQEHIAYLAALWVALEDVHEDS
jgi:hypothetical protein